MTRTATALPLAAAAVLTVASMSPGQASDQHTIVRPDDVQWQTAPPVLPRGAQAATLYGDPAKEGPFGMRVKLPANYRIPPHTHPRLENVTILSGAFNLGMGEQADPEKVQNLTAGAFFSMPPGVAHYVMTQDETVIEVNAMGPWGLTYVNPQDDPRQAAGATK